MESEKCKFCGSDELSYLQLVSDSRCGACGRWQGGEYDDIYDLSTKEYQDIKTGEEFLDLVAKYKGFRLENLLSFMWFSQLLSFYHLEWEGDMDKLEIKIT